MPEYAKILKFNPNHAANGEFTSGKGGKGGKGSAKTTSGGHDLTSIGRKTFSGHYEVPLGKLKEGMTVASSSGDVLGKVSGRVDQAKARGYVMVHLTNGKVLNAHKTSPYLVQPD